MKVQLERINKDYLFEVRNEEGRSVILDNKSKSEGVVAGISPMELLLMGVAGCSSIDIIAILGKQKINPETLRMEVYGHRKEGEVPALFHTIEITIFLEGENITPEKATRAAQLSYDKYCSVSKMIDSVADIQFKIVLNGKPI
ncbi:MAG: OsmC family protein [Flavobacteriaceae bacterium]